ncbi:MAG: type I restriction endonuclease subunit R [Thermoplasmatota archaeon]
MSEVGARERRTQARVVEFFQKSLGYSYLGNWEDRGGENVEAPILRPWLLKGGYDARLVGKALDQLAKAKHVGGGRSLYDANRDVYELLRYGVKVKPEAGEKVETVWLIDWKHPEKNDFGIAEEVTVAGEHEKRPDVVLYVNGIALGVLELKRSTVSVSEGIRQNLDNQKKEFIEPFFSTVQLVMAGNDTEGLRYGVVKTPEKYYLNWKEEGETSKPANQLDTSLAQVCRKGRLLEIIHDFMVFDAGTKKTCRHSQYFGVRAAQEHVKRREGGVIWHAQGTGKSLTMVWLAKWIRENVGNSRVLLITDREELDDQIEQVFTGVGESIYRTSSGADLVKTLDESKEPLICSLVHKFGTSEEGDIDAFLADMASHLPKGFHAKGEVFVFVDECHRTQSGKLHDAMTSILPGAMFVGFTGTPLLKKDKKTSIEVFGPYIHTYRYDEAVRDQVVLDLCYEARDIDQKLMSQPKVDQWFDAKTKGLTSVAKAQLKKKWGTMQKVLSSKPRLEKIVADILLDMETRPRLASGRGNAILVSGSIFEACRFYEMFHSKGLAGRCAIITSYRPNIGDIKGEESGEGDTQPVEQYKTYRQMLAQFFDEPEESAMNRVEEFEKLVKQRFIKEPGQMKLLIVVDKLLTGFDAPPATYLYIDKKMRDHGLFQAICRVNRLDPADEQEGDVKEYGYIVDYKDLFESLEESVQDYTTGAFDGFDPKDVGGLLKSRLDRGRERLDELREAINVLCEPVEPPRDSLSYKRYFCGSEATEAALKDTEPKRVALYKVAGSFFRAYTSLANEMEEAGYSGPQAAAIRAEVAHFEKVRDEVRLASGDYIDMKMYEPAMRHLLDTYIQADDSVKLSAFEDMTLVQLIVERGDRAFDSLPRGLRDKPEAMAEAIENNVRKVIIDERGVNPKFYEKMSDLLDSLIQARKKGAMSYREYLAKIVDLAKKVAKPDGGTNYPAAIKTAALRALYDNLNHDAGLAERVDSAVRDIMKAEWRGNKLKEKEVRIAIKSALGASDTRVDAVFEIVKRQHDY